MSEPRLIIDPGHGGRDPGGGSNSHWLEKDKVLDISLYQYERFRQLNVPVALTRNGDTYLSPTERTRIVRESGARDCISNHLNAAGSSAARGAETIHSIHSDGRLARMIQEAIVDAGMPGRRVFTRSGGNGQDYYFMHRETGKVETVIVEYGFATNPDDTALLIDQWQKFAEAVVRAYCNYAGFSYTPPGEDGSLADENQNESPLPQIQGRAGVIVDGEEAEAYLIDNRVYVPVRFVSESLGARVKWDNRSKTAQIEPTES